MLLFIWCCLHAVVGCHIVSVMSTYLKANGILFLDTQKCAEIPGKQCQFVLSKEDPSSVATPTETPSPSVPEIEVTQEGALKLLKDLKENKASGPFSIPSSVLNVAAEPFQTLRPSFTNIPCLCVTTLNEAEYESD